VRQRPPRTKATAALQPAMQRISRLKGDLIIDASV
jgi:ABC-type Fe3+-citrate transport system substrate-binding protein